MDFCGSGGPVFLLKSCKSPKFLQNQAFQGVYERENRWEGSQWGAEPVGTIETRNWEKGRVDPDPELLSRLKISFFLNSCKCKNLGKCQWKWQIEWPHHHQNNIKPNAIMSQWFSDIFFPCRMVIPPSQPRFPKFLQLQEFRICKNLGDLGL